MRGDFFLFFHGHIVADIGRKEKPCFLFFAAAYTGMSAMLNAKKEETHLEKNDTAVKICGTTEGRLPGSCAPLAFPYVPVQCDNPARYSQQDALQAGTLFPGLNLPFHADMENRFPAALEDVKTAIRFLRAHANGESTCSLSKCNICFVSIAVTGLRYYMP